MGMALSPSSNEQWVGTYLDMMQQVPPESGAPGEMDTEEAIVPTDMNLLTGQFILSP
jgi:hypothetical protein